MTAARRFLNATVLVGVTYIALLFLFDTDTYSDLVTPGLTWLFESLTSVISEMFEVAAP